MNPWSIAAVSLLLLVAYPSIAVPEAAAPSHPSIATGLHGHVLSDAGGSLGGAFVRATGPGGKADAVTSPDGAYAFDLPPGTYALNVSARAHKDSNTTVVVGLSAGSAKDVTLVHTGVVVRGRVIDGATGQGVANASVAAYQDTFVCIREPCDKPEAYQVPVSTLSGPNGAYALGVEAGNVLLRASAGGYHDADRQVRVDADKVEDLKLHKAPPRTAVLRGAVVDAATGAPVAGAWVNAWPSYEPMAMDAAGATRSVAPCPDTGDCPAPAWEGNSTQTDARGRFRMDMQPGRYGFSVGAAGYGHHQRTVALAHNQTLDLDVALQPIPPDSVLVKGVVLDKATGKPVAGAWVNLENPEWGHYNGTQAREDGRFEFRTKPGWNLLRVHADGGTYTLAAEPVASPPAGEGNATSAGSAGSDGSAKSMPAPSPPVRGPDGSYYPWVQGMRLKEGETADLKVELQPKPKADVRIVGYVLNATSGKPVPGAWVNLHNEDTGDWGHAQTFEDGSFVMMGRAGMHTLQAYAERHFHNAVVFRVLGPETRMDISLEPGESRGWCCVAYAMKGEASADGGRPTPGAPPSPTPAASPGARDGAQTGGFETPEGAASYQSASRGLGPYTPPKPGAGVGEQVRDVPGAGALGVLAALGAGVALARRRR